MKITRYKLFPVWQSEKEEQWLNRMAQQGYALTGIGFCRYTFEECKPGEYQIRIQLLEKKVQEKASQDYIRFLEDSGIEYVGNYCKWIYVRRQSKEETFELFSDNQSKINQINSILKFILPIIILNLFVGIWNIGMFLTNSKGVSLFGVINLAIAVSGFFGWWSLYKKRTALQKDS